MNSYIKFSQNPGDFVTYSPTEWKL